MTTVNPTLLDEAHRLALLVAPELETWPLYITQPPAAAPPPTGCRAYATVHHDAAMRSALESSGQWKGVGRYITYVPSAFETDSRLEPFYCLRDRFLQTILHETAHLLPASQPAFVPQQNHISSLAAIPDVLPGEPAISPAHGPAFVRRALHLWVRSIAAGVLLPLRGLCADAYYGMRPPLDYLEALGDEPARLHLATFEEVEATPPPLAFVSLAIQDIESFGSLARLSA